MLTNKPLVWSSIEGDYGKECDQLIAMGAKYALGSSDWWWLGEQILMQAVSSSSEYCADGSRREAIAKYLYAKYLIENRKYVFLSQKCLSLQFSML